MEGGYSSFESNSRGSRFDDRDHQSRFDDRNHRSKYDDREHRSKYDDRRSPERFRNRPSESEEREWPPCFDSDGSAFVFDNRSAMFYESQSNFFYDPKSKLYYGNKKGAYFRYDKSQDPPFVQVQKMPATSADGETPKDASEMTAEPIPNTLAKPKPTIAINLKTTKKPKQAKRSLQGRAAPVVSKVEKERIANIEKWNEKQAEMKPESTQKISTTLKGEPICTICKRKFPSIEKLRLHERASELHKSNLAKLANAKEAENAKQKEAPAGTYQDRAQKRRDLHGIDAAPLKKPGLYQEQSPTSHPTPSEGLGSNNIGNQMLKKMGWQESDKPEEGQQSNIRKDWDRIESLANSRQRPPR
jgi:RNA-binding protein 5/10